MFDPYKVAEEFDKKLNKLLEREPITTNNALDWLLLIRTIDSSLNILEELAQEKINFKFGNKTEENNKDEDEKNTSGC